MWNEGVLPVGADESLMAGERLLLGGGESADVPELACDGRAIRVRRAEVAPVLPVLPGEAGLVVVILHVQRDLCLARPRRADRQVVAEFLGAIGGRQRRRVAGQRAGEPAVAHCPR